MVEVAVNKISGYDDAICAMFIDGLSQDKENSVRVVVENVINEYGLIKPGADPEEVTLFREWMDTLMSNYKHEIKFIKISCTARNVTEAAADTLCDTLSTRDLWLYETEKDSNTVIFNVDMSTLRIINSTYLKTEDTNICYYTLMNSVIDQTAILMLRIYDIAPLFR